MQLFFSPDITSSAIFTLDAEESRHCLRVLRKKIGEQIEVVDGKGNHCVAEITSDRGKLCELKVMSLQKNYGMREYKVSIAIAVQKNRERFEWFLEKATEIGIDEIQPMITEKTEKTKLNTERFRKILISAMKQSGKAYLPVLHEPKIFSKIMIDGIMAGMQKFIAVCGVDDTQHLKNAYQKGKNAMVLIGPEGDFTGGEVKLSMASGFQPVSLGKSRLRVETAGMVACHIVNLMNEE